MLHNYLSVKVSMTANSTIGATTTTTNEVPVERYHRPDAPVLGFLGCWIRAKLNAASRCDHWDAVMAVLVLRGHGQEDFLHGETLAYVLISVSKEGSVSRQTKGTRSGHYCR